MDGPVAPGKPHPAPPQPPEAGDAGDLGNVDAPPRDAADSATVTSALGGLRAAVMLLSRLPTGHGPLSVAARRWASAWFPLVGVLLAATAGGIAYLLTPTVGSFLAAIIAVACLAALTGALHEDGLADTADALGGARDRAQIFVILKDSRHGTYGVLALALVLLLRIGALERLLPTTAGVAALALAGLLSRWMLTWMLFALPYVTPAGTARSTDVAHGGGGQVTLASVIGLLGLVGLGASALLPWMAIVAAIAATLVTAAGLGLVFFRRAGGITGDFLGATAQLTEGACLLALVALQPP